MSGHKHSTDRVDGTIVAECVECAEYSATVDYSSAADDDVLEDLKTVMGEECHHCGGRIAYIEQETQTEVLD